ncbi:MAG: type II toxin-antitoxin system RelB/DinJ family antitoxin, partial [Clostridia bacterium]|nr:type II toxin-antitoxin system RelB/DinJ family antitoxin [Clostridia bacterium]
MTNIGCAKGVQGCVTVCMVFAFLYQNGIFNPLENYCYFVTVFFYFPIYYVSQLCYNIFGDKYMKSEVIHARVQSDIKRESDKILNTIGITLSQAVDLFL